MPWSRGKTGNGLMWYEGMLFCAASHAGMNKHPRVKYDPMSRIAIGFLEDLIGDNSTSGY